MKVVFTLNAKVNVWKIRGYAPISNAPSFNYDRPNACQKLTVWTGLCGNDQVLGYFFFDNNLTGNSYLAVINMEILLY